MKRRLLLILAIVGGAAVPLSAQQLPDVDANSVYLGTAACRLRSASGTPEGVVVGKVCDVYVQSNTGDVWTKQSGSGNTGWGLLPRLNASTNTFTGAMVATSFSGVGTALTALNASNLGSGNVPYARMPTGSGTWTGTPTITGSVTFGTHLLASSIFTSDVGELTKKMRSIHAGELVVETLVAQSTMATIGGRILVAPTNVLTADLSNVATTITVKYNNFANGDRIYLEESGNVEWMAVTSGAGGSAGLYTYTVTRNLDGTGANTWAAGAAALDTGTTGNGFLDLYSTTGVLSGSGPTIVGNVRTGTTYNNIAPRWAIGNLNGLYGYGATTFGAAFGDSTAANLTIDATNGLRIRDATTVYAQLSGSVFTLGLTGGNRVAWDGTSLTVVSSALTIDSSGVRLAPTTITTPSMGTSYGFTVPTGGEGLYGHRNAGASRSVVLYSYDTTASGENTTVLMQASSKSDFSTLASFALNSTTATSTIGGSAATWTLNAVTSFNVDTPLFTVGAGGGIIGEIRVMDPFSSITLSLQPQFIGTTTSHDLSVIVGNSTKMKLFTTGGIIIGAPTGGDKGAGTLNVQNGVYLNGTAFTNPEPALANLDERIVALEVEMARLRAQGGKQ